MSVDKFGRSHYGTTKKYVDENASSDKVSKSGDTMTGNLRLSIGDDNTRALGCSDLNAGNKFRLLLGSRENQLNFSLRRPITLDTTDGFLIKVNNERVCQIGTNSRISAEPVLYMSKNIWMNGKRITELPPPRFEDEAVSKSYVDNLSRKTLNGYIPTLQFLQSGTTESKSGFTVTASSHALPHFVPVNVFNDITDLSGGVSGEWRVGDNVTTNFWISIQCPEQVRVWRIALRGRHSNTGRIFNWALEGSTNGGQEFNEIFRAPNPTYLGNTIQFFPVNTPHKFNYYRLYCYEAESHTDNPGLSYMQLYIYSE